MEQQLKLHIESIQFKLEDAEKQNEEQEKEFKELISVRREIRSSR